MSHKGWRGTRTVSSPRGTMACGALGALASRQASRDVVQSWFETIGGTTHAHRRHHHNDSHRGLRSGSVRVRIRFSAAYSRRFIAPHNGIHSIRIGDRQVNRPPSAYSNPTIGFAAAAGAGVAGPPRRRRRARRGIFSFGDTSFGARQDGLRHAGSALSIGLNQRGKPGLWFTQRMQ